jgi:asparagine synthetase B (glutamine-hydrolysing)
MQSRGKADIGWLYPEMGLMNYLEGIKEYMNMILRGSDIFEELTYYHLPRLDKMSMAHTLELRSPFLNLDIVRFAYHLPLEWGKDKKILKDTFGMMIPEGIVNREKAPLKTPSIKKDKLEYRQKVVDLFLS